MAEQDGGSSEPTRPRAGGDEASLPPPPVPGYRLVRRLGAGGQAVVWEAVQVSTGRSVALKLLAAGALASETARARFRREMELVSELDHPGIVRLADAGFAGEQPYLVLDLVEGEDLAAHVARHGLRPREVVALVADVADAVEHAHRNRVIHRDLKPSNVLVDAGGRTRVVDFGAGRFADAEAATQTRGGALLTPTHASPEQLRGEPVDTRTDVYSLGVVLHELLAGGVPWPGGSSPAELAAALSARAHPEPPSRSNPAVDRDLDTVVLRALAEDRDRRYESAAAFGRDLRHWIDGEPVEARRDSGWYLVRKTVARHRLAFGAAATVVLTLAGLSAVLAAANQRLQDERDRARRAEQRADARAAAAHETSQLLLSLMRPLQEAAGDRDVGDLFDSRAYRTRGEEIWEAETLPTVVRAAVALDMMRLQAGRGEWADVRSKASWVVRLLDVAGNPDTAQAVEARALLARALLELGRLSDARAEAEAALDLAATLGPEHAIGPWTTLASIAGAEGDGATELALLERALAAARGEGCAPDRRREASSALAAARAVRGELDAAAALLGAVIEEGRALGLAGRGQRCDDLAALARIAVARGDDARAEALLREAAGLARLRLGSDAARTASIEVELARVLDERGRGLEARLLLEDALPTLRLVLGAESPAALDAATLLARVLAAEGGDEAAPHALLAEIERARVPLAIAARASAWRDARALAPAAGGGQAPPVAAGWTVRATRPMSLARHEHAAVLLDDGRVLVAGGRPSGGGTECPDAEVFDPATETWTPVARMELARAGAGAARVPDGRVLIAGGWRSGITRATDTAEVFDPATETFRLTGPMSVPRAEGPPIVVTPDGRVLVIGGTTEGVHATATDAIDLFDPKDRTFRPWARLALSRTGSAAVALADGRVLVLGGRAHCCGTGPTTRAPGAPRCWPLAARRPPAGRCCRGESRGSTPAPGSPRGPTKSRGCSPSLTGR